MAEHDTVGRLDAAPSASESLDDLASVARHITRTLFTAQSLGSAAFISAATVNTIAGAALAGHPAWAGVPAAVYQVGGALAAYGWGYAMDRFGRRLALASAFVIGVAGALVAGSAVMARLFSVFLFGMVLMGVSNAAMQLARFAAAEVHSPRLRGRAISNVVVGGTFGAVAGPLLVGPAGQLAHSRGLDELTGAYAASLILLGAAGVVIFAWLKPDPREIGRAVAASFPEQERPLQSTRSLRQILAEPAVGVAMAAMVLGQMVMVMLMVITSLYMKDHQHPLSSISLVISSHTFGMYAFSIFSGRLADRWGRSAVIMIGAATLVLACLAAPLSPAVLPISLALFLLGLGWNFCYVGGSSLLADQLSPAERSRTQGFNDLLIGLTSATGSLSSGVVFAAVGYGAMGLVGALVALVPFVLTVWWRLNARRVNEPLAAGGLTGKS